MGALLGIHERSTIGASSKLSVSGSSSRTQLLANPAAAGPAVFVLLATQDMHLRQGTSSVTATTNDFLLKADIYYAITVENKNQEYIAAIQDSTAGTLYITNKSNESP